MEVAGCTEISIGIQKTEGEINQKKKWNMENDDRVVKVLWIFNCIFLLLTDLKIYSNWCAVTFILTYECNMMV